MDNNGNIVVRIVAAYRSPIIRLYVRIRFHILRQRFLEEIGQYLPERGAVLDIGCGFGLFSLYFASGKPNAQFEGFDLNRRRILEAQQAAATLGICNVRYEEGNASSLLISKRYDAIYMLDIVHHIPENAVEPLIKIIHQSLTENGILLIKDIDTKPIYKRWFTWWLDKLMDPSTPVHYWSSRKLMALLTAHGFTVRRHHMVDYLPYPHILYICRK